MFVLQQTQGQYQLELKVTGVTSSEGNIAAALYTDSDSFLEFDKVFKSEAQKAYKGTTVMFFSGLPEGEYAVAIFHDSNGNGKLDTNWLGIPKEKVAFSKAKMKTFGPPNFGECAFTLDKDTEINIALND
jgi:uncharacterized protein (DUF2141 family)